MTGLELTACGNCLGGGGGYCSSELPQRALGTPYCYCIRLQDIILASPRPVPPRAAPHSNPMRHAVPADSSSYAEVEGEEVLILSLTRVWTEVAFMLRFIYLLLSVINVTESASKAILKGC